MSMPSEFCPLIDRLAACSLLLLFFLLCRYKKLEKQLEHLDVMEDYIKLETRNLEKELLHAQEEVRFIRLFGLF